MGLLGEVEETLAFNLEPAVEVDNVIDEHKETLNAFEPYSLAERMLRR